MACVACRLYRPADATCGLTEFAAIGGLAECRVRTGRTIAVLAVTLAWLTRMSARSRASADRSVSRALVVSYVEHAASSPPQWFVPTDSHAVAAVFARRRPDPGPGSRSAAEWPPGAVRLSPSVCKLRAVTGPVIRAPVAWPSLPALDPCPLLRPEVCDNGHRYQERGCPILGLMTRRARGNQASFSQGFSPTLPPGHEPGPVTRCRHPAGRWPVRPENFGSEIASVAGSRVPRAPADREVSARTRI